MDEPTIAELSQGTTPASEAAPVATATPPQPQTGGTSISAKQTSLNLAEKAQLLQNSIIAGNIPQIVMYSINYALLMGASDIHIEPEEKTIRVRFRVDGVLRHIIEYPVNIHPAVVSRIKIMSNLKIDEQRIPQDGRTQVTTEEGRNIDLRVSSLPTVNGEKIVMRLQDKTQNIPDLPDLGLTGSALEKMERFVKIPNGIILVTGPTGSGKTNTMYSALNRLNRESVNILTFEDPVEYQMDGLNQSQVHPDIEYNFAVGLRTALRQDPDIIMVGEIRDEETIETATRAALTGHLVLSTVHTNNAVSTLTRISDMGVRPFMIVSSIRGIIAQRLVRKICDHCKEEYSPKPVVIKEIQEELKHVSEKDLDPALLNNMKLYRGKGCGECGNMGYKGRLGVFEILEMNRDIAEAILAEKNESDVQDKAKEHGMLTLKQDALIKALMGETSLEEVYRIIQ